MKHGTQDDVFSARLNSCLLLQKQYRDMIRTLRDNFGAASSHSTTALAPTPGQPNPLKRSFLHPGNIAGSQASSLRLPSNLSSQGNVLLSVEVDNMPKIGQRLKKTSWYMYLPTFENNLLQF